MEIKLDETNKLTNEDEEIENNNNDIKIIRINKSFF